MAKYRIEVGDREWLYDNQQVAFKHARNLASAIHECKIRTGVPKAQAKSESAVFVEDLRTTAR